MAIKGDGGGGGKKGSAPKGTKAKARERERTSGALKVATPKVIAPKPVVTKAQEREKTSGALKPKTPVTVTVKPGDTNASIAERLGVNPEIAKQYVPVVPRVGTQVTVPVTGAPTPTYSPTRETQGAPIPERAAALAREETSGALKPVTLGAPAAGYGQYVRAPGAVAPKTFIQQAAAMAGPSVTTAANVPGQAGNWLANVRPPSPGAPPTAAAGYAQYRPAAGYAQYRPAPGASLGFGGNLTRQQMVEAARWSGIAIFSPAYAGAAGFRAVKPGVDTRPNVMSIDVAMELPFNPKSPELRAAFLNAFGVEGFSNAQDFLVALGYQEEAPGKWRRMDPVSNAGLGGVGYGAFGGGGYYAPYEYGGTRSGYNSGSGLIQWRIGL